MKKIIFIFFILITSFLFSDDNGFIYGKIIKEKLNFHSGIKVELYNGNGIKIGEKNTFSNGDFYFNDIVNDNYVLVADADSSKIKINIIKDKKQIKIDTIKIKGTEENYIMYLFSKFLLVLIFILNLLMGYFIKKGAEISKKKSIILLLYSFNFMFIFEILRALLGVFSETDSANIEAVGMMPLIFGPVIAFYFICHYPVKRFGLKAKIFFVFSTAVTSIIYLWINIGIIFNYRIDLYLTSTFAKNGDKTIYTLWDFYPLIIILAMIAILLKNIKEYKGKKEAVKSRYLALISGAVFLIILFMSTLMNRVFIIPFDYYSSIVYCLVDGIIFYGVLIGLIGFKKIKEYNDSYRIFSEITRYFIVYFFFFIGIHYSGGRYLLLALFILSLKLIIDMAWFLFEKSREEKSIKVKSVIELSINKENLEVNIKEAVKKNIGNFDVKIISVLDSEWHEKELGISIEDEDILSSEEIEKYIGNKYSFGVKIKSDNKCIGILLCDDRYTTNNIGKKEIDLLCDIGNAASHVILRLIAEKNLSKECQGIQLNSIEKEKNRVREIISFAKIYSENILKNAGDRDKTEESIIRFNDYLKNIEKGEK